MNFEAVIFDMDGVLVDSEPHYIRIEKENFRILGLQISDEEHQTYQGTATDHMWKIIKQKHGIHQAVEDLVMMTNRMTYPWFESQEKIEKMPGVEEFILFLIQKKIPIALASSSYPDVIELILTKTGLKKYFSVVIDSRMAGKSKPAPDIFLLAADRLGVNPEKCLVIEDSTNGISAAKAAGMYCMAYAGPGSEFQDQSRADILFDDFKKACTLFTQEPG